MLRHYITLRVAGVPIPFTTAMRMAVRGTLKRDLVHSLVVNHKSSLNWPITDLEVHEMAGGNLVDLVNARVVLKAADVSIDRRYLMAANLA